MKLHIVSDLKGQGRIVGVFDKLDDAKRLTDRFPAYYKLHTVELNEINPDTVAWADNDEQKAFIEELLSEKLTGDESAEP